MPAYLTHAIMGETVHKKAFEDKLFRCEVDLPSMTTFSLGADLSGLSKISSYTSHNQDTRAFFLYMIDYIKSHKLIEDSQVLALLYGHMAHYFLDINCHPLVYYNEVGLKNGTKISNHMLVEGFLSYYVCTQIAQRDYMQVKAAFFNQGDLKYEENKKLIESVYTKIYHDPKIIKACQAVLSLFTLLENGTKSGIFTIESLSKLTGFTKFLEINGIQDVELLNLASGRWTNPVSGEIHHESFLELYEKGIIETLEAIKVVNKYLYDGCSREELYKVFTNLSYDTGVDCSLGHQMVHVRNKR